MQITDGNLDWTLIFLRFHYSYPWETVVQAAWRKYPNPMNTAVVGIDVVDRKVTNGILFTHRLVMSKWKFPAWASPVSNNMMIFK